MLSGKGPCERDLIAVEPGRQMAGVGDCDSARGIEARGHAGNEARMLVFQEHAVEFSENPAGIAADGADGAQHSNEH